MDLNDDDKGSDTAENHENGENRDADVKEEVSNGKVVQVTNVSPGATLQQLATLFGFLGTVTDIRLYPSDETVPVQVKVCFINYESNEQCGVAQHLTNTVFIDKALIVVPINREEIPEESECQHLIKSINAYATLSSTGYLPSGFPPEEPGCSIPGIPPPPVITSSADPVEIEEIKRTIFVQNIEEKVSSEQLMAFFSGVGEIKYMRLCKTEPTKYAFIEFTGPESVPTALQYNGVIFGGKCLKVEHAKSPIIKPESERIATGRNHLRTSRDIVKRPSSVNLRRSRSRSRSRRSRSRGRTSITRSKPRSRSGSRSSRRRKSRSKSPRRRSSPARSPIIRRKSRSRSRSRTKRRSRSRTRSPVRRRRRSLSRSRSRSRSWSKRRRSRSRSRGGSRERRRRRRSTSRSTSRSPRRSKKKSKSRSRSPRRRKSKRSSSKSPDRRKSKGKDKDEKKDRSKDKSKEKEKDKGKEKDKSKEKEKELSPEKDLKSLLDKVYNYEEEKEREKERKKSSKEKELSAAAAEA